MKKIKYLTFSILLFLVEIICVNAESGTICNIGTTDGLLYSNDWNFTVVDPTVDPTTAPNIPGINNKKRIYIFSYSLVEICSTVDCDKSFTGQSIGNVDNLASDSMFRNLGTGDQMYTTAQLIELFNNNKCPKYIYVGSSAKDNKIGFIFSDKQISNAKTIFENAGYKVSFEQNGGQDLDDLNIKNFEKQISEMKEKIQEYEDNNWGNVYDEKCSGLTYFGGMHIGENLILQEYDKLKLNLPSDYKISDEYKSVYNKYKNIKCAEKKNEINIKDENYDMDLSGCIIDAGTQEIIDWIMNIIRVGGILLLIVLGMLDFIKAAASGEQEEMKKSKSKFIKRLIACVGLFLIPLVVDILLGLINLAGGANGDCSSKTVTEITENKTDGGSTTHESSSGR